MSGDTDANQVAISSYSRAIASALEQRGIDASTVFERAGVPMSHTVDPLRRMSNAQISALFRESVEITRDPYFGLFVAETFQISQLHVLGFALLSSSTLRDFCLRLQNYYHMASRNADISLLESGEGPILVGRAIHPDIDPQHALLKGEDSHFNLKDLSLSGTFINGTKIEIAQLRKNQTVKIGNTELVYHERK